MRERRRERSFFIFFFLLLVEEVFVVAVDPVFSSFKGEPAVEPAELAAEGVVMVVVVKEAKDKASFLASKCAYR